MFVGGFVTGVDVKRLMGEKVEGVGISTGINGKVVKTEIGIGGASLTGDVVEGDDTL
jgi:hypothetical protein